MIPHVIHCCWFGGAKTKLARKCRASWERFASDWEIREFVLPQDLPPFVTDALAAKRWAVVSDWARMRALFDEGGVYLDYDVELVRPFEPPAGEWVAGEWTASGGVWMNPGSGIALEKGSAIARHMLDAYEKLAFDPAREMMPWINDRLAEANERVAEKLKILPPEVLSAIDMRGCVHRTDATLGIHHYALSWGGPKRKILQWFSWHGCRGLIDFALDVKRLIRPQLSTLNPQPSLVASFWEEHCCECAMPACYGSCPLFERGWHGRCVRLDGFEESVFGTGTMRFRRWGKLEMMYHGALIGIRGAARLGALNALLRGVWRGLGAYHRALRWRLAVCCGRKGAPDVWRLRLKAVRDERLSAVVAYEDGREVLRVPLDLAAGVEQSFELALPSVENRALFRLFATDGEATDEISILENAVSASDPQPSTFNPQLPKCVAWDLDGTLWTGTLSEGDEVVPKPQMVELVKALDARGIVNSICSKNDAEPALAKLRGFGLEEYFVFPQINWGPKSASLRNLAQEMNIALDAIVFVDDREENRAEVRVNLPEVCVLDEKEVLKWFDDLPTPCGEGAPGALGARRRLMYREEMARRGAARAFAGDDAAFLAQSGLVVEMAGVEGCAEVERCRELVNRTNQLTITARRYSEAEFDELLRRCETCVVRVHDKYGDYGIVGFVAWRANRLEELVFSCRVARKGVERQVLDRLPKGLTVEVVATDRNAPIREIVDAWRKGAVSC